MDSMGEFRMQAQLRARGPATIMAIGTATPPNCVLQNTYPDYYFRITESEHMKEIKEKFRRICEKYMIKKRYMYLTEEILKEKPNICAYMASSFDDRQAIMVSEIPELGQEAATQAINEWGRSASKITHLVFCTTGGVDMPGADYQLMKLLGLNPSVKRCMIYYNAVLLVARLFVWPKTWLKTTMGHVSWLCAQKLLLDFSEGLMKPMLITL